MNALSERLHAVLALDPAAPAVEFDGAWSTWGELASAADAVDAAMRATGLGAGSPVGLMLRNRPAALGAFLGLLRAGACVVTVNPLLGAERLRADLPSLGLPLLLGAADDLALVPGDELRSTARGVLGALGSPIDVVGGSGAPTAATAPGVAVRMLTSGTTGPPKRIDLRYEMLELVMRGAKHYETGTGSELRLRSGVVIVNAPLVHVSGVFRVVQAVLDGRRIALLERFSVDGWVRRRARAPPEDGEPRARPRCGWCSTPTSTATSSTACARWSRAPRRSTPISPTPSPSATASPCSRPTAPPSSVAGWRDGTWPTTSSSRWRSGGASVARTPVARCASSIPTSAPTSAPTRSGCSRCAPRSSGRTSGCAPPTSPASTPTGSSGSWAGPTRPSSAAGTRCSPRWCAPRSSGTPAVVEAAVVGVPDARLGAVPVAAIERRPGHDLDERHLLAEAGRHLARYEVPVAITVVDALPRTASGKADLAAVRAMFDGEAVTVGR